jgi:hypothetical protein
VRGGSLTSFAMRFIGERVDARRIHPAVIEIEQCAHCDREVDRLVVPSCFVQRLHIGSGDPWRVVVYLRDEPQHGFVFFIQVRSLQIMERSPNQFLAPKQFSRNCGMRLQSKRAVIARRRERRNQLAHTGSERRRPSHYFLGKVGEMSRRFRSVREQVPDLRVLFPGRLERSDTVGPRSRLRGLFHMLQEHRILTHVHLSEQQFQTCLNYARRTRFDNAAKVRRHKIIDRHAEIGVVQNVEPCQPQLLSQGVAGVPRFERRYVERRLTGSAHYVPAGISEPARFGNRIQTAESVR